MSRAIAQPEIRWVAEGKVVLHDGNVELSVIRQNSQWWLRSVSVQTDPLGKSTLARFKTSQDNSVLPPHIEGELERAFEKEKAALSAPAPQDDLAKAVRDLTERLSGLEEAIKNKT